MLNGVVLSISNLFYQATCEAAMDENIKNFVLACKKRRKFFFDEGPREYRGRRVQGDFHFPFSTFYNPLPSPMESENVRAAGPKSADSIPSLSSVEPRLLT